MLVRICPDDGSPMDFDVDIEYSLKTEHIEEIIQQAIFEKTNIEPDKQNACFCPTNKGMKNATKLTLPADTSFERVSESELQEKHPDIFSASVLEVATVGKWEDADLLIGANKISMTEGAIRAAGRQLQELYKELNRPRVVKDSLLDEFPYLRDGIQKTAGLRDFLRVTSDSEIAALVTGVELECYSGLYRTIEKSVARFSPRKHDSSALHAQFFASEMMNLPFLKDEHKSLEQIELIADRQTALRIYLQGTDTTEIFKYTPKSDHGVVDKVSNLPLLICEVDSHVAHRDGVRMLMQGVVACRQWAFALPQHLRSKNRLIGLFVNDAFDVALYLFHADANYKVQIHKKTFRLRRKKDALLLARILFNYRDSLLDIAGHYEMQNIKRIQELYTSGEKLPSFTSASKRSSKGTRKGTHKSTGGRTLDTVPESSNEALVLSDQVVSLLCLGDAFLESTEHENVAVVKMLTDPSKTIGYVKATNRHELDAFNAIRESGSKFLLNRVILPTRVVEVSGHSIAFLPYGGDPLEYSWGKDRGPMGHEMEIVSDLLNIVACLHEIHIAHMDIKMTNILWDTTTRSIRVIDFDASAIVDPNGSQKIKGKLGTPGFMAPEVGSEEGHEYDPFLADAFSCGKTIQMLALATEVSRDGIFVSRLSDFLAKEDSNERWSIKAAIQAWEYHQRLWRNINRLPCSDVDIRNKIFQIGDVLTMPVAYVH